MNILRFSYKFLIVFPILTKCELSGHILLQILLHVKFHVNASKTFRVPWDGQSERRIEKMQKEGQTRKCKQLLLQLCKRS